MALSSDAIIKQEIIDQIGEIGRNKLRIFVQSSSEDQKMFSDGGLTFGVNKVPYGSCDACWYVNEPFVDIYDGKKLSIRPTIVLEGTDALNRKSSGNAQYQRFHHALGAVRNGVVGVYYLRKGSCKLREDLYGMAYNASKTEKGTYLIIDDLAVVKKLLQLHSSPDRFTGYLNEYLEQMKSIFDQMFQRVYGGSWKKFADKRSTIVMDDYIIKYAGRNTRNFTDGSQRAGHIAVGEMYLSKYYFIDKKMYYLFPRMTLDDLKSLDHSKRTDKEWYLLRNEPRVEIKTVDDIGGLDSTTKQKLLSIKNEPLLGGEPPRIFNACIQVIRAGLINGTFKIL